MKMFRILALASALLAAGTAIAFAEGNDDRFGGTVAERANVHTSAPVAPFGAPAVTARPGKGGDVLVASGLAVGRGGLMAEVIRAYQKQGRKVTVVRHNEIPGGKFKLAVGHSAGADAILRYKPAPELITIDPTILNPGCPAGAKCHNFHFLGNAIFIFCCGGYPVAGAVNESGGFGHGSMPARLVAAGKIPRR